MEYLATGYTAFEGGVRKYKGSDTWKYKLTVGGKTTEGDTGETNKRKAQAWVQRERLRHKSIKSVETLDQRRREEMAGVENILITEAWDKFLKMRADDGKPIPVGGHYHKQMKSFWKWFEHCAVKAGIKTITQISPDYTRKWMAGLIKNGGSDGTPLARTTINLYWDGCKRVVKLLLRGSNLRDPFDDGNRLDDAESVARDIYSPEIIAAIMQQANPFCKRIAQVGLLTGRRLNEICNLRWDSLKIKDGKTYLMPRTGRHKNGTKRKGMGIVPVEGQLALVLAELEDERDEALRNPDLSAEDRDRLNTYVLPCHHETFERTQTSVSQRFSLMMRGLKGVTIPYHRSPAGRKICLLTAHSLRHTFIHNMSRHEKDLQKSMKIAGHKSEKVHRHYRDHWSLDDLSEVMTLANTGLPQVTGVKAPKVPEMNTSPDQLDDDALIEALRVRLSTKTKEERGLLLAKLIMG